MAARLGDVDAARAECVALGEVRERHARQAGFFDALRSDVHFAFRSLARSPGWTAVALLTIALGVGSTTTVFSIADSLLLRPLGYRNEANVYVARREMTLRDEKIPDAVPVAVLQAWRDHARTIEAAVPFSASSGRFGTGSDAPEVFAGVIDAEFVPFTGVRPVLGRNFTPNEVVPGARRRCFWRNISGGALRRLSGRAREGRRDRWAPADDRRGATIVGRHSEHQYRSGWTVWVPFDLTPGGRVSGVAVRLKPGVSAEAARQELDRITSELRLPVQRFGTSAPVLTVTRPQERFDSARHSRC